MLTLINLFYVDIHVILFEKKRGEEWGLLVSGSVKSHISYDDVEQGYCVVSCREEIINRFQIPAINNLHFCDGNGKWSVLADQLDVTSMPVLIMTGLYF